MPTYDTEIMRSARKIARLSQKRSALKRELKHLNTEICAEKRLMKRLIGSKDDYWPESGARFKTLGNRAGE